MPRARPVKHAGREVIAVARGSGVVHARFRRRLGLIFGATAVIALLSTAVVFLIEHNAAGTEIHDVFDAFLFATAQLLTGSSVADPATDAGKVLELVFDVWAIFVVASLAGSFGAFFHGLHVEAEFERLRCTVGDEIKRHLGAERPPSS